MDEYSDYATPDEPNELVISMTQVPQFDLNAAEEAATEPKMNKEAETEMKKLEASAKKARGTLAKAKEKRNYVFHKIHVPLDSSKEKLQKLEDIFSKTNDGFVEWNTEEVTKGYYNLPSISIGEKVTWVTDLTLIDLLRDVIMLFPLVLSVIPLPFFFGLFVDFLNIVLALELWPSWLPEISPIVHTIKVIVFTVIGAIFTLIFEFSRKKQPEYVLDGQRVVRSGDISALRAWTTRISAMIMLLLYIPVIRDTVDVFTCGERFRVELLGYVRCYSIPHVLYIVGAVVPFAYFAMFVPFYLSSVMYDDRPRIQSVNRHEDGNADIVIQAALFRERVKKDESASKFLYSGYKYRYTDYKILMLFFKFITIAILTISASFGLDYISAVAPFILVTLIWLFHVLANPFLVKSKNFTASTVYMMIALMCLLGFSRYVVALFFPDVVWLDILFEIILFAAFLDFVFVFFIVLALANDVVRRILKGIIGRIDFSKDCEWELWEEGRRRIWDRFWDNLFERDEELKQRGTKKRLDELKGIASQIGSQEYRRAMRPVSDEVAYMRKQVLSCLEGVDVFWDGTPTNRKKLRDRTKFGKLSVEMFPFRAVLVYDNCKDFAIIEDVHTMKEMLQVNESEEILRRRLVRVKLRCLDGEKVRLPWTQRKIKPFGMEFQRTEEIEFKFNEGLLKVHTNDGDWGAGFNVTIEYIDGVGQGPKGQKFTEERLVINLWMLGVRDDYEPTELLNKLFEGNKKVIGRRYPEYMDKVLAYRKGLLEDRLEKERTLSTGFWSHVYNNPRINRDLLKAYLVNRESNEAVSAIPEEHEIGLHYLYQRVSYYFMHPAVSYWYCWFDDLWNLNKDLPDIERNAELLSPEFPGSLVYRMMPKTELVKAFKKAGIFSVIPYHLVGRRQIDALYSSLNELELIYQDKHAEKSVYGGSSQLGPSAPPMEEEEDEDEDEDEESVIGEYMDTVIGMDYEMVSDFWAHDKLHASAPEFGSSVDGEDMARIEDVSGGIPGVEAPDIHGASAPPDELESEKNIADERAEDVPVPQRRESNSSDHSNASSIKIGSSVGSNSGASE